MRDEKNNRRSTDARNGSRHSSDDRNGSRHSSDDRNGSRRFSDDRSDRNRHDSEVRNDRRFADNGAGRGKHALDRKNEKRDRGFSEEHEVREGRIEGRNAVIEAFRSGRTIDKLYVLQGCHDGPVQTVVREAEKAGVYIQFVTKERLDQMSDTGSHQGVIADAASYEYSTVEDILKKAEEKQEPPFVILLDGIEDPHNLGAIIRSANLAGAHGVIIPKHRAVGLTATVMKTSAGALNFTPVAKVTNLGNTIEELKEKGMWFYAADMGGTTMYQTSLTGSLGLVIGAEGSGVSRLVKEKCDGVVSIPMQGDIDSLNASVAAGVLMFEAVRQRTMK